MARRVLLSSGLALQVGDEVTNLQGLKLMAATDPHAAASWQR